MSFPTTAVPPHSLDAERSVLGAVLLLPEHMAVLAVDERLVAEDFYREQHGDVYAAMYALFEEGRPVDTLTVLERMREQGTADENTAGMVDELAGWVPAAGHLREYARIVREHSLRRKLLLASYEMQAGVFSRDASLRELIENAERSMLKISDTSVGELALLDSAEEVARLAGVRDGVEVVGTGTGFKDLDKLTSGFHPGNLIVIAARPAMGKSALVVNIAENVAADGKAVAIFSLEMSRGEILRRMLASRGRVPGDALLRGPIPPHHWERIEQAVSEVGQWPLYVDSGHDAGVLDIRAKARRLAGRVEVGLVIVDYIQLMRADAGAENRNIEVGKITRGLKILAGELGVPVIAVSQLSRQVEHRQDKRPQLSDLRDSGSVEQDADMVLFLYRDSYYNDESEEPDVTELNLAKSRNGPLGRIKLTFLERYPRFSNYTRIDEPLPSGQVPTTTTGERMDW